jgi:NAD(P)H-hydrate epimerase
VNPVNGSESPGRAACRFPRVEAAALPWLSVEQMRDVDRLMLDELGISLVRMMENAGRSLGVLVRSLLDGSVEAQRVLVMAGPGGNGGGGLVAARHLAVAGALVEVRLATPPERLTPVPAEQLQILRRMGVGVGVGPPSVPVDADLVIDALLGYSQTGDPRGDAARLIEWSAGRRVLALDNPSGLELSTGRARTPCVHAEATMTLALPKLGLRTTTATDIVGRLFLADISVPAVVYERLGLRYGSPFAASPIVELEAHP